MTRVNENVVAALKAAAVNCGQPKEVAQRLVSWLDALATGNADPSDANEAAKRIADLLEQVKLPAGNEDLDALLGDEA